MELSGDADDTQPGGSGQGERLAASYTCRLCRVRDCSVRDVCMADRLCIGHPSAGPCNSRAPLLPATHAACETSTPQQAGEHGRVGTRVQNLGSGARPACHGAGRCLTAAAVAVRASSRSWIPAPRLSPCAAGSVTQPDQQQGQCSSQRTDCEGGGDRHAEHGQHGEPGVPHGRAL